MSNLHLVTGYAGQPHVAASDHGSLFEATIRPGQFVTEAGSKFAASVISNNQIQIADGELVMQGRHIKLEPGNYIDVAIDNGAQGFYRNDLIVARYAKNANSSIESVSFVVIKGTPAESEPSDPAHTSGDINGGNVMQNDMPMYRVPLNGLNIGELVPLFTIAAALRDEAGNIPMRGAKVTGLGVPTDSGDAATKGYVDNIKDTALLLAGGQMQGAITTKGIYLTENEDYGPTLPAKAPKGKLFFLEVVE